MDQYFFVWYLVGNNRLAIFIYSSRRLYTQPSSQIDPHHRYSRPKILQRTRFEADCRRISARTLHNGLLPTAHCILYLWNNQMMLYMCDFTLSVVIFTNCSTDAHKNHHDNCEINKQVSPHFDHYIVSAVLLLMKVRFSLTLNIYQY